MSTEVILMEDVAGLGDTGDLVKVADGYARNYLLPRNLAAPATDATRRRVQKRRVEAEAKRAVQRQASEEIARKLAGQQVVLKVKAGEDNKLFGSVTNGDIADALLKLGFTVDRHQIELPHPLKELGDVTVPVRLFKEIKVELKVSVVKE